MKKVICISASNIITHRDNSASTKACNLAKDMIKKERDDVEVEIIELGKYDLTSCDMCEGCASTNECIKDSGFNEINKMIHDSDGMVFVVPHYAPIPSKLMILIEKLQEIYYLNYCLDSEFKPAYFKRPVGLIIHGGGIEGYEELYKASLLNPVSNGLRALGLNVLKVNDERGVMFGVEGYEKSEEFVTHSIKHNWDHVSERINPMIESFVKEI